MPADIESMMIVGEPAWHGLGNYVNEEDARDWRKAYLAAGLDWRVTQSALKAEMLNGVQLDVTSHVANVRSSDAAVLGIVGANYTVLQNEDVFAWFQPFLDAGECRFEAAGALKGGARIWALARVTDASAEVRPGDRVDAFVLLSHSHDGSLAVRVGFTPIRVVCNNTLTMAHNSDASRLIRIKHRGDVNANLRAVRDTMDVLRGEFRATAEQYRALASKHIQQRDVRRYVELVLEPTKTFNAETELYELSTKAENIVSKILERAIVGASDVEVPTLWDAYNGVTEWLTWERGRTQDSRINSLWYGDSAKLNARALEVAREMAEVA
jgi:phage/plasmid-like protein (TIGR03299 family)